MMICSIFMHLDICRIGFKVLSEAGLPVPVASQRRAAGRTRMSGVVSRCRLLIGFRLPLLSGTYH